MDKGFGIKINQNLISREVRFIANSFDNIFLDSPSLEFVLEGVLINISELITTYASSDKEKLISVLFHKYGINFINKLEGEFCGYIIDKANNQFYLFMNFTATKKLFYYHTENLLIVDTSLLKLKEKLQKLEISTNFDKESAYSILVCGNLLENMTPLQGVKRLMDRQYIKYDLTTNNLELKEYFTWGNLNSFSGSESQAIDMIHETFEKGVRLEYSKDTLLGADHFALLSGGLDSRVALMYANRIGYRPSEVLCFSQKGYLDEKIAFKICEEYNFPFLFVALNGGGYLKDIDDVTLISEGTVNFAGGIHTNFAYKFINRNNLGLIHSGQLGDGVLGGFNKKPFKVPPSTHKIISSRFLQDKFSETFHKVIKEYDSEELFLLKNIGYNRAVFGSYVAEEYTYQTSPFMTSFFLKHAVSLPESWKTGQKIYLKWIQRHCKDALKFKWERTILKPNAQWKTKFGDVFMTRAYRMIQKTIFDNREGCKMCNYEYYYDKDQSISQFLNDYYLNKIEIIEDAELRTDMQDMFKNGNFKEKMLVITVLGSHKYLFQ